MTGALVSHRTPSRVPVTSAARVEGKYRCSFSGHSMPTARVAAAMAKAPKLMSCIASGMARMAPTGPPETPSAPMKGEDLKDDDYHAYAGHESGDDGVWRVCDESSDFEDAEEDLYDACENDNAECFAEVVRSGEGYDGGHSNGHGAGRSGNLRFGTAEYSGEESDSDSAVDTGDGAET